MYQFLTSPRWPSSAAQPANSQEVGVAGEDAVVCRCTAAAVDATADLDALVEHVPLLAVKMVGELIQRTRRLRL